MKKVILLTACTAAVLLSGCSDNELASVGDGIGTSTQSAIGFHVVGNQAETRAIPITPGNLTATDFDVFAFTTAGKLFMGNLASEPSHDGVNIKYDKDNSKWDYNNPSDLRYWPESPLNFYAISPGTFDEENMTGYYTWNINKDKQQITYNWSDEYNPSSKGYANIDIMYGIAKDQTPKTNSGKVKFQFRHILSQVAFKAKTQEADMEVEIEGIRIYNLQVASTFTFPADAKTLPTQANWSKANATKGKYFFKMKQTTTATSNVSDIFTEPMLFIPQSLTPWATNASTPVSKEAADNATPTQSYLEISCKIKKDGHLIYGSINETGVEGYKSLYVPFGQSWEPGKRYIYTLIFGGGYNDQGEPILNPINFEADVDEWTDETAGNVNL